MYNCNMFPNHIISFHNDKYPPTYNKIYIYVRTTLKDNGVLYFLKTTHTLISKILMIKNI